jgi:hypothetical protein
MTTPIPPAARIVVPCRLNSSAVRGAYAEGRDTLSELPRVVLMSARLFGAMKGSKGARHQSVRQHYKEAGHCGSGATALEVRDNAIP